MTGELPPILLLGGGKMGGAMLAGWRERGLAACVVVDPAPASAALAGGPVQVVRSAAEAPHGFRPEAVVLAVKPQSAAAAVPPIVPLIGDAVVLSIMAGKTVAGLRRLVGETAPVVRAMPNTPAAVRQGITVGCAGPGVTEAQRALCEELLAAIGEVAWVDDEGLIDPVTAVSGGGPAYVFLLTELLEQAAVEQGIPPALARRLARVTVSGSGALLAASDQDAADLRAAVTSPGGTTQRALAVLMEAWPGPMSQAIAAATSRSRELGS
jgi:pyrroline-5-carboxylate reductase